MEEYRGDAVQIVLVHGAIGVFAWNIISNVIVGILFVIMRVAVVATAVQRIAKPTAHYHYSNMGSFVKNFFAI